MFSELHPKGSDKDRSCCCIVVLPLTETFSEIYLKKPMGKTDLVDALERLDRLTQEDT